jgi:hypothetical protein
MLREIRAFLLTWDKDQREDDRKLKLCVESGN